MMSLIFQKKLKEIRDDLYRYGDDLKTICTEILLTKRKLVEEKEIQIKGDAIDKPITEKEFVDATTQLNSNNDKILQLKVKQGGINDPVLENLKANKLEQQSKLEQSKVADRQELARKNDLINKQVDELRNNKNELREQITTLRNEIGQLRQSN